MKKIAFLVTDGFEDIEVKVPYDRLKTLGYKTVIVGTTEGREITGKRGKVRYRTELSIESVTSEDFDAIIIPGGYSPDKLRVNSQVVDFVREFYSTNKPIAAICHGPQLLITARVLNGHQVTGWESIAVDIENAGGDYVDDSVVIDRNIISSRKPKDIPQFIDAIISEIDRGNKEELSA